MSLMPYDLYGEDAEAGGWLASVRARMRDEAAQRAQRPNWGETRWVGPGDRIPLPAYDSNIGELLMRAFTMGPLAVRSGSGARAGNDAVWATRVERNAPASDPGITGGFPHLRTSIREGFPGFEDSSLGMMIRNPEITPATAGRDLAPYYPARQDFPMAAANSNLRAPITGGAANRPAARDMQWENATPAERQAMMREMQEFMARRPDLFPPRKD